MSGTSRLQHRVLVVEDEALIALDLERRLSRAGFEVVGVADNCDDALELFAHSHPDLVLMDIFIQGPRNGIETARAIAELSDVPVVFLTAYADDATVQRAAEISPYGYLLKPFDELTLSATITVALERYAADTRLRLLGAAVEAASVGIALLDVRGDSRQVVFCNEAYLHLNGADRGQTLGRRPIFTGEAASREVELRLEAAVDGRQRADCVLERRGPAGERSWLSVTLSPVPSRNGQITHLLLFQMDITRQRLAEAALAESQRLEVVGRLTAGIAHDFNNLLGAIVGFAELAREGLEDDARSADIAEVLHAARRGVLLTRKLLDFSRRGEAEPTGAADLTRVVAETRPMIERLIGPRVSLDLRLAPEVLYVQADETSIEQIVLNLVANARDVMPQGGRLTLTVRRVEAPGAPPLARLEVSDTGPGIDGETQRDIFKPFFTTKARGAGTGLGLATSKMLVERANGTIVVHSVAGQGATFCIDLPLTQAPAQAAGGAVVPSAGSAGGATALLVEDEGQLRRAAARALADVGFQVVEAATGEVALRELEALGDAVQVVVCDMVLPGIGGAEVLAAARRLAPQSAHLVVTGYYADSAELTGLGAPILWKPYTPSVLARRALEALETRGKDSPRPVIAVERVAEPRRGAILLVEDDPSVRAALRSILEGRGYRVTSAATGAAALERLVEGEQNAAVVDINLPDIDGVELLSRIRKIDPMLPTLVMTGDPSIETVQRALRGRAAGYLTKPISPGHFIEEVGRAVEEGQVARLQHKLLLSKAGGGSELLNLKNAEERFDEALRSLRMVFQPIVRAHDGSVFAYEALLRTSSEAFPNPGALLPAAEVLGRVVDLGRTVRSRVAEVLRQFPDRPETIFVNLHPAELSADLLTGPDEPLLPFAQRVVLEVTERAQLGSGPELVATLQDLRNAGYRVALDDLGEGYAGLSWLVKLAPDLAKLDMSLVRDIPSSPMKQELVSSLVGYCQRAGTVVVAEGVETPEEATTLRRLGCDLLQGYFFARPGPPFPAVVQVGG